MENKQTHVNVDSSFTTPTGAVENVFNDNIAYVKHFNFSKANLSNENRIAAISQVASVCYQNPKAAGSVSLYDRLLSESGGLPSSSFEFVPMLFKKLYLDTFFGITNSYGLNLEDTNILKYGEKIIHNDEEYLLTNFRAVVYDFENFGIDLRDHFNTEEECAIIAKHFNVFQVKIDMPTFGQMVRHRVNWQVLSRRYVSGERVPFDFYLSEKMLNLELKESYINSESLVCYEDVIEECVRFYYYALDQGVRPEEARRIIPQCAYTIAWCAFQPRQLESYFELRCDSHAQQEIRLISEAMKSLLENNNG